MIFTLPLTSQKSDVCQISDFVRSMVHNVQKYHDSALFKLTFQNFINMAHQELLKEVGAKLTELNNRFENISSSGEVHLIDVDILLQLIRDIYLKTTLLKKEEVAPEAEVRNVSHNYTAPAPAAQPYKPAVVPEFTPPSPPHIPGQVAGISAMHQFHQETAPAPQPEVIFSVEPETIHEPQILPELEPIPEPRTIPEPERMPEPQQIPPTVPEPAPIPEPTPTPEPDPEPVFIHKPAPEPVYTPPTPSYTKQVQSQPELFGNGSLADKHKTDTLSINDRIVSGKSDHTLADKIKLTPLRDIKAAIGINEKFQFINELFEGSGELYNEAIALLNNCSSAFAANQLFADYQRRNNWDAENRAFLKFKEYVERRYLQS